MTTRGDTLKTAIESIRTAAQTLAANADALQFQAPEPATDGNSSYTVKAMPDANGVASQAGRMSWTPFSAPGNTQEAWVATSGSSVFLVARIK